MRSRIASTIFLSRSRVPFSTESLKIPCVQMIDCSSPLTKKVCSAFKPVFDVATSLTFMSVSTLVDQNPPPDLALIFRRPQPSLTALSRLPEPPVGPADAVGRAPLAAQARGPAG